MLSLGYRDLNHKRMNVTCALFMGVDLCFAYLSCPGRVQGCLGSLRFQGKGRSKVES